MISAKEKARLPALLQKLRKMLRQGIQPTVIRIAENLTKEEAFGRWESFFIAAVGRLDLRTGPLCNLTAGGDGFRSLVRSEEHRRKIRAAARRRIDNGEIRNTSKFSFKGHVHSVEVRETTGRPHRQGAKRRDTPENVRSHQGQGIGHQGAEQKRERETGCKKHHWFA